MVTLLPVTEEERKAEIEMRSYKSAILEFATSGKDSVVLPPSTTMALADVYNNLTTYVRWNEIQVDVSRKDGVLTIRRKAQ